MDLSKKVTMGGPSTVLSNSTQGVQVVNTKGKFPYVFCSACV